MGDYRALGRSVSQAGRWLSVGMPRSVLTLIITPEIEGAIVAIMMIVIAIVMIVTAIV
jgi:hypothetical protein